MRAIILILIVGILLVIAGIATGLLNITQTRDAKAPAVSATHNGVMAKGGQAPAFDVETGSVRVGAQTTNVKVPTLTVQRPGRDQPAPVTNDVTANAQ